MAFTRFHDDNSRIEKQLQELMGAGRYMMNVPGPGDKPCFMDDPYLRLQQWGANLNTNAINLESDLMGLTRPVGRDDITEQDYKKQAVTSQSISYPTEKPFVEESRATHPAWMFRDLEHPVWEEPIVNPQSNLEKPFHDNIQTRILEKDYYKPQTSRSLEQKTTDPMSIEYYIAKN